MQWVLSGFHVPGYNLQWFLGYMNNIYWAIRLYAGGTQEHFIMGILVLHGKSSWGIPSMRRRTVTPPAAAAAAPAPAKPNLRKFLLLASGFFSLVSGFNIFCSFFHFLYFFVIKFNNFPSIYHPHEFSFIFYHIH